MHGGADQVSIVLTDPFGVQIRRDDEVFFAGTDYNRRPTINKGQVEAINVPDRKVLILRSGRSGNAIADATPRRIWVEVTKIAVNLS